MKYAKLTLKGQYRETGSQVNSLAGAVTDDFRFDQFLIRVEKLIQKPRVCRVLIVCDPQFRTLLWGGAEAIRTQLRRLREAGKELWFYAIEYHPLQLYLASACTYRVLHPLRSVSFLGLSRSFLFFKKALNQADIDAVILRRGEYKSAGDRFRTDRLDYFNHEQYQQYFDTAADNLFHTIAAGYSEKPSNPPEKPSENPAKTRSEDPPDPPNPPDKQPKNTSTADFENALQELQTGRILSAEQATAEGWITQTKTLDRLESEWKDEKYHQLKLKKTGRSYISRISKRPATTATSVSSTSSDSARTSTPSSSPTETEPSAAQATQPAAAAQLSTTEPTTTHPTSKKPPRALPAVFKRRKKIAVLVFEGAIIDGTSKQHPLLGQALGAESFVPHIRSLQKDKTVKGVVLRVNSGGGSATASEDILDALSRLREKKPLVVSMSEVAGSGGYWISCTAERLFAHHSTLTGSIGVITMFFYL